jgi:magnesium chelatase family protein
MLSQVISGACVGVDAVLVRVEVDMASGLPAMCVVGLAENAVREGRERVLAALLNSGFRVPPKRITVNLAPADMPKHGSAFDLPLAVGLLCAAGEMDANRVDGHCLVGELGLDGEVRPVRGVLSIAMRCHEEGIRTIVVPPQNAREASVVADLRVVAPRSLQELLRHLLGHEPLAEVRVNDPVQPWTWLTDVDFADVKGQEHARRALEVAAAGQHNVLLVGPPGSGKSMLARRLPTILPPPTHPEALEVTRVYSVAGRLRAGEGLLQERPFRAPHHTVSDAGLVGGGNPPRPGEVSLAHHGVLFLDELPEYRRHVLEALRQPLEDGYVNLGRARVALRYPSRFMLVAAMNPCPCGYFGTGDGRCICHSGQVHRYRARISGPVLDRIDIHVDVPPLRDVQLTSRQPGEPSAALRERVMAARARQLQRFRECPGVFANAHMGAREVRAHCTIDEAGETLLRAAVRKLGLSARAFHRILRLARTIADLEDCHDIRTPHLAEAIQYRTLDRTAHSAFRLR